jgi:hypothetical protein
MHAVHSATPRAERGEVHCAIDTRIPAQRIEGALRVELTVVARPRGILEMGHVAHCRRFVIVSGREADERSEARTWVVESRHRP